TALAGSSQHESMSSHLTNPSREVDSWSIVVRVLFAGKVEATRAIHTKVRTLDCHSSAPRFWPRGLLACVRTELRTCCLLRGTPPGEQATGEELDKMGLDPDFAEILEALASVQEQPWHAMTPDQARAF